MSITTIYKFLRDKLSIAILLLLCTLTPSKVLFSQLNIDTTLSPEQLVQDVLIGDGITATNITYSGSKFSIGKFTNGSSTNIGLDGGILLSTGKATDAVGPNQLPNTQFNTMHGSDPELAALSGGVSIYDAVALEFDFVPMSDTIRFEYVFASEEYDEWVGTSYNDVFGFFITGNNPNGGNYTNVNLANVPNTNIPITINTINNGQYGNGPCNNCSYYINNIGGTTIEYDGFTVVLKTWIAVIPCTNYHIKLAIGDGNDHSFDSGVFLKRKSFTSGIINLSKSYSPSISNSAIESCNNANINLKLNNPSPFNRWVNYSIGGTAINGVDYQLIPDSILIPAGQDSVAINIIPINDGITEGQETIEFIVETSSCSLDTISIKINDYDNVSVVASTNKPSFCIGDSTAIQSNISFGVGPFSYLWSNNDVSQSININPNNSISYIVKVTDACGVSNTDTIDITVNQRPIITATSNVDSICLGDSANLKVNGANTYNWSPNNNISSINGDSIFAWPSSTTTYNVIGTDNNGCKDTTLISLNIKQLPNISINPAQASLCIGDSTNLISSGGISYLWAPAISLSANTGSNIIAKPSSTTSYIVKGIGANACINYDTATVIINNLPNVNITPNVTAICNGDSKQLSVSGASNYIWSPASALSSTTGNSVVTNPINTIIYSVIGTDTNNCINTDSVEITVNQNPIIVINSLTANICEGDSTTLSVSGANTYSWLPNSNISNNTDSIINIWPIINTDYTVIGTDNNGCKDTITSSIIVAQKPILTTTDSSICIGDSTILTVSGFSIGSTFLWSTGDTSQSITVNPSTTTTYYLTTNNNISCNFYDSIIVYIAPSPIINISSSKDTICIGENTTVTTSGIGTFSWLPLLNNSNPNGATTTLSPTTTTTYYLTANNGCFSEDSIEIVVNQLPNITISPNNDTICDGDSVILEAFGGSSYLWNHTITLSETTTNIVTAKPTTTETYIVTGTSISGCKNTDTTTITLSPLLQISALPTTICLGDSSLLEVVSNVPSTYLWSNGNTDSSFWASPIITENFSVTVTSLNGCTQNTNIDIIVDYGPDVIITPDSSTICQGDTILLAASGALSYQWFSNSDISSNTGSRIEAMPTTTDSVKVTGTNQYGCESISFAHINVIPNIEISTNITADTICEGSAVNFSASTIGSPLANFIWSPSIGLSDSTDANVMALGNTSIQYQVTAVANNGCRDSAFISLRVEPKPIITISPDSLDICIGKSTSLSVSGADTYLWSPNINLVDSLSSTINVSPAINTTYTVIGTTTAGCKDTTNTKVYVHQYPVISISSSSEQICPGDSAIFNVNGADNYKWTPNLSLSNNTTNQVKASPDSSKVYTVIGSTYGCTDTLTAEVIISPLPKISGNNTICNGDSTTLYVNSNLLGTTFLWNSGGFTSDSIIVSPSITTTYSVTATDASMLSCTNTDTFVVNVNALPPTNVQPADTSICPGESLNINVNPDNTYKWSPNISLSDSVGSSIIASPTISTTYKVIATSVSGCIDSSNFYVGVFPQPNVNVSPVSSFTCGGGSQQLVANGMNTYSWSPTTNISSITGSTIIASPPHNTNYTVTGIDTNLCIDTAIAHIIMYCKPVITASSDIKCKEDTVTLTANCFNTPISYLWNTGEISKSINVDAAIDSNYYVTVTYPGNCIKYDTILVSIYNDLPVSASSADSIICHGNSTNLNAINGVSFSWSGANLNNTNSNSVIATPDSISKYIVEGISSHACKSFDTVIVDLFPYPNISISTNNSIICLADSTSLLANGGVSYLWSINNNTDSLIKVSPTALSIYNVIGTDTNGCKDTAYQQVSINYGPSLNITPQNIKICQGDTISISASGASSYFWSPNIDLINPLSDTCQVHPSSASYYNLRGTDSMGCYTDTSFLVDVGRKPFISVTPAYDSICMNDSIEIHAYGVPYFDWEPENSLSDSIGAVVYATPTATTTYKITGISSDGCIREITSTIKVYPNPVVQLFSDDNTLCIKDTTNLIASGAINYQWSPNYNLLANSIDSDSVLVHPSNSTTYQVLGTNIHGCVDSTSEFIEVFQLPNSTIISSDTNLCFNDSVNLSIAPNKTIQWTPNYNLSNDTINNIWASPLADTTYFVKVIDSNSCINYDTIDIIVHPEILPTIATQNDSICLGLSTNIIAGGGDSYLWSPATGINSITNDSVIANPISDQTYNVKIFDAFGCSDSISTFIKVLPLPNLQITPISSALCYGQQDTISVSGAETYLWSPMANVSNINNDTVIIFPTNTDFYKVIGTDSLGCINYDSILVTVHQLPNVQINSNDTLICFGDSTDLIASGANTYNWWPLNGLSNTTSDSIITNTNTNTVYHLQGTDTNNCVNYDSIQIAISPLPILTIITLDTVICENNLLYLDGSSDINPTQLLWSTGDSGITSMDYPNTNTIYTLYGTTLDGCKDSISKNIQVNPYPNLSLNSSDSIICDGDSVNIISNTGGLINLDYLWSSGNTSENINYTVTTDSTFTLIASDSIGCSDTSDITIYKQNIPSVDLNASDNHVCENDTVVLTTTTSHIVDSYAWNIGSANMANTYTMLANTTYFVTVTDSIGCTNTDSIYIQTNAKPQMTITPQDNYICIGGTTVLNASSNLSPINYLWNTNSTSTSINISPTTSTSYTVHGTDSIGCTDSTTFLLTVHNLPILNINPSDGNICLGDSIELLLTANTALSNYSWSTSDSIQNIWVSPTINSNYSVTATDIYGCINDTTNTISVHQNPVISINPQNAIICSEDSIQLLISTNIPAQSILWDNGNTLSEPYFAPMLTTSYSVILTDTNGCFGYDSTRIIVTQRATCDITGINQICSADTLTLCYNGSATSAATTNWDFGGANFISGTGINDHKLHWNSAGNYDIILDVTENGCTSRPDTLNITIFETPKVEIYALETVECDSTAISFSCSPGGMQSYSWSFGDPLGIGTDVSNIQNPNYTYNVPGTYSVHLNMVSNDGCIGDTTANSFITINPVPGAGFDVNPEISYTSQYIHFIDKSVSGDYWQWNFGDSQCGVYNSSTDQSPTHYYSLKGEYLIQQIVSNQFGCADTAYRKAILENGPTFYIPNAFTPNGDGLNDVFVTKGTKIREESFQMYIYNRWGEIVFHTKDYYHYWDGKHYKSNRELNAAVYTVYVMYTDIDGVNQKLRRSVTILK